MTHADAILAMKLVLIALSLAGIAYPLVAGALRAREEYKRWADQSGLTDCERLIREHEAKKRAERFMP